MPISKEALRIRKTLVKEVADPSVTFAEEREAWQQAVQNQKLPSGITSCYHQYASVACLDIRPDGPLNDGVILYLHGGGLVAGSAETHATLSAHLSLVTGMRVIVPNYRLLPESIFPAPLEDCLDVYDALIIEEGYLPKAICLGGDSHGAALAVGVLTELRERELPQPAAAFSISGAFDSTLTDGALEILDKSDPVLSLEALRLWKSRIQTTTQLSLHLISPMFADLSDLSPILLLAAADDIWRNDTVRLGKNWRRAGGEAEEHIFEGMWHVWPMWPDLPESKAALELISKYLNEQVRKET